MKNTQKRYKQAADIAETYLDQYSIEMHKLLMACGHVDFAQAFYSGTKNLGKDVKNRILKRLGE